VLGVYDLTINSDGKPQQWPLGPSHLQQLKNLVAGKHEYRVTSMTATVTVATRLGNDGEIVLILNPKNWTYADVSAMKSGGASYRYVSSQTWAVSLTSPGEWAGVANSSLVLTTGGYGLEKDTQVSVLFRGNVQTR